MSVDPFWSKVAYIPFHECWEWGAGMSGPYGWHHSTLAHRYAYELTHEHPIPKGMVVRHKCDNPTCVRPEHLELGTQADNVRDMNERGRNGHANKTHCKNGHPYSGANLYVNPKGERYCRTCKAESARRNPR